MAKHLDFSAFDVGTRAAMLEFLNRAPDAAYLMRYGWIKDAPFTGYSGPRPGYAIGATVARRIIDLRNNSRRRELRQLRQLDLVRGLGQDKINDLAATLSDLATHRNRVTFFIDGPACRSAVLDTINSAEAYLHLTSFMFFNDEAGQAVADALVAAAGRGVQVRVMFEQDGSRSNLTDDAARHANPTRHDVDGLVNKLQQGGVTVINTKPIDRRRTETQLRRLVDRGMPQEWADEQREINRYADPDFNHVDHTKLVIADGRRSLVMSIGIGNEYLYERGRPRPAGRTREPRWHDGVTQIVGGASVGVNQFFAKRWMLNGGDFIDIQDPFFSPEPRAEGTDTAWMMNSYPGQDLQDDLTLLLGRDPVPIQEHNMIRRFYGEGIFAHAHRRVLVGNPYPIDHPLIESWLRILGLMPNLDFRLIRPHPDVNDFPMANTELGRSLFRVMDKQLLDVGARVFEYTRGFTHVKVAVVDNWMATHGSYNLNYRSARKDLEFVVVIESRSYAAQVAAVLMADQANTESVEVTRPAHVSLADVIAMWVVMTPEAQAILSEFA